MAATAFTLPGGARTAVTVSIGVGVYDGHPDYNRIIARADSALYAAKDRGRNRSVLGE